MNSKEDRLSSLPDDILINILSRLQINSVVATSVLSHRWRYLWTAVTAFKFDNDGLYVSTEASIKFSSVVVDIVRQLTSRKLHVFKLKLTALSNLRNPSVADACFWELCCRNVKKIIIKENEYNDNGYFFIPAFLFSSKNLVVLELHGRINFDLTENTDIQLPNLRKINLDYLINGPQILRSLFRSCERLIDAKFILRDYIIQPEPQIIVNISAQNLRSLKLRMSAERHAHRLKIIIDAPKLKTLYAHSKTSDCYSINNPSKLVEATIRMHRNKGYRLVPFREDVFKFVKQMLRVRDLTLLLECDEKNNVYRCLVNAVNHGLMLTFPNLERLVTSLSYDGWKELLLSMSCFPFLRNLKVVCIRMDGANVMDPTSWCAPECLSKLKTITITRLLAIDDDLVLLEYILSNALVLEKLHIMCSDEEVQFWNAIKFCKSLFKLPRASSTCEIVFSIDGLVRVSSNDLKNNGDITCVISSQFHT